MKTKTKELLLITVSVALLTAVAVTTIAHVAFNTL